MRLKWIFTGLFLLSLPLFGLVSSSVEDWIKEKSQPGRSIAGIFETSPSGLRYNRGFPRGIWGTNLAPELGRYDEGNQSFLTDGFFWNRARSWLNVTEHWTDPQLGYDAFWQSVMEYMCDNGTWACCVAGINDVTCSSPPAPMQELVYLLMDPTHNMPVLFLYWWCTQAWEMYREQVREEITATTRELRQYLFQYCPSPCMAKPCRHIPGVEIPNACNTVGPYEDDFECICRKDFVWDQETQTCKPINPCFHQSYMPCSKAGTLACVALNMQRPQCICKPGYTGPDCGQLQNACLHRFNSTDMNGNTNCGVIQGNLCYPILGTDFYRCTCDMGWVPSPTLTYDNCDVLNDPCNSIEVEHVDGSNPEDITARKKKEGPRIGRTIDCQNQGFCASSPDNTKAACLCPAAASGDQGFAGTYCEIPRGVWSAWTHYSDCRDKYCGVSRYKWRRRQCLNETFEIEKPNVLSRSNSLDCFGITEEVIPCEGGSPCDTYRLSGYYRREIFHFPVLYVFVTILTVEVSITFLLYKTCGYWLLSFIIRLIEDWIVRRRLKPVIDSRQTLTYVCEEVSDSEVMDMFSKTTTVELFIDDKVETKPESPEPLDNEQYLELLRQRIIQRILELLEEKERERARIYDSLIWSKPGRFWAFVKSNVLNWIESTIRWYDIVVRPIGAVIRSKISRPANEGTFKLTEDRKAGNLFSVFKRYGQSSSERNDLHEYAERHTFIIRKKVPGKTDTTSVNGDQEQTMSMFHLPSPGSHKSPSISQEDTVGDKDMSFTSDIKNNPERVGINKMLKRNKSKAQTSRKHVLKRRPTGVLRHKNYIPDTSDQISSSEFNTDNDDTDKTTIYNPVPKAQLKGSILERRQSSDVLQRHKMEGRASERMTDIIKDKKETLPPKIVLSRPSVTFGVNEAQRLSSKIAESKLFKALEDESRTDVLHAPVSVTSMTRRMRQASSAGGVAKVYDVPRSSHRLFQRRSMEDMEFDTSNNAPSRPIERMPYSNMHYPAVVEVSIEENDEVKDSGKYFKEKSGEKKG